MKLISALMDQTFVDSVLPRGAIVEQLKPSPAEYESLLNDGRRAVREGPWLLIMWHGKRRRVPSWEFTGVKADAFAIEQAKQNGEFHAISVQ